MGFVLPFHAVAMLLLGAGVLVLERLPVWGALILAAGGTAFPAGRIAHGSFWSENRSRAGGDARCVVPVGTRADGVGPGIFSREGARPRLNAGIIVGGHGSACKFPRRSVRPASSPLVGGLAVAAG